MERTIRVTIPLKLQATALVSASTQTGDKYDWLGQIIGTVYTHFSEYIITDDTNVVSYLEEIYPEHLAVLQMFEEIIIEEQNDNI
jgi:hypothetical protein